VIAGTYLYAGQCSSDHFRMTGDAWLIIDVGRKSRLAPRHLKDIFSENPLPQEAPTLAAVPNTAQSMRNDRRQTTGWSTISAEQWARLQQLRLVDGVAWCFGLFGFSARQVRLMAQSA